MGFDEWLERGDEAEGGERQGGQEEPRLSHHGQEKEREGQRSGEADDGECVGHTQPRAEKAEGRGQNGEKREDCPKNAEHDLPS